MLRALSGLLLLLLTACDRPAEPPAPTAPEPPPSVARPEPPAATAPSPGRPDDFHVGRWATEAAGCAERAWVITRGDLTTPGEVYCRFDETVRTERGLEVDATCWAQAPPERRRLRFAYAESAKALLVEGGPFADVGLVRCDAPDEAQAQDAADVVRAYYARLAARDFAGAGRLWRPQGGGGANSAERLEAEAAPFASYSATVGAPSRIEGAAGSLYVTVPIQVDARRRAGAEARWRGEATLRRSNDVPGATAEQRAWRIERIELRPA